MKKLLARRAATSALGTALGLGLALAGAAGSCTVKTGDHPLVRAYLSAEPVTPVWNPDISPPEPMWTQKIELPGGSVTVSARCCVGQGFVARFSDEPAPRKVFTPGDYVYPSELRVALRDRVVYGRASGLAGGITNVTKIFAYDLDRRRLVDSAEIDPGLLPPVREPASPRPVR
jgi:hypothetical protein